ncbi:hypothetical protein EBR21_03000, partial [bacterium]|nr:hypothetical protein [bacterium]
MLVLLAAICVSGCTTSSPIGGEVTSQKDGYARSIPLSQQIIAKENRRWEELGVNLHHQNLLLADPFRDPAQPRSFIVPTDWYDSWDATSQKIITSALRKDLLVLKRVMQDGYGGWDIAAKKGWNWDLFFAQWDSYLASLDQEIDPELAFSYFERLKEFQLDNHTGFMLKKRTFAASLSALVMGNPKDCDALQLKNGNQIRLVKSDRGQQPKSVLVPKKNIDGSMALSEETYVAFPLTKGNGFSIICSGDSLRLKSSWQPMESFKERHHLIEGLSKSPATEPTYRAIDSQIGYLRLPSFSAKNVELLQKLSSLLPSSAGKEEFLIIDMRLNEGGDGGSAFGVLQRWLRPEEIENAMSFSRSTVESCTSQALSWGYEQFTKRNVRPPVSGYLRDTLQAKIDKIILHPKECKRQVMYDRSKWNFAKRNRMDLSGKKILLLVDNMCGSDCEFITYVLGSLPRTVIAG